MDGRDGGGDPGRKRGGEKNLLFLFVGGSLRPPRGPQRGPKKKGPLTMGGKTWEQGGLSPHSSSVRRENR